MIEHGDDTKTYETHASRGKATGQLALIVSVNKPSTDLRSPRSVCADDAQRAPESDMRRASRSSTTMAAQARQSIPTIALKVGQKVTNSRRGELDRGVLRGTLPLMSPTRSAGEADADASPLSSDGVSAFIAKVLDQLALGSWLPAAFFVASAALVLQFRSAKSTNLLYAVRELSADPVQVLVVMVPILIIATFITQAFSFESIRAMEGYWRGAGPIGFARTLMIRKHIRRKNRLRMRRLKESQKAFQAAMPRMILRGNVPTPVLQAIEAQLSERGDEAGALMRTLSGEEIQLFADTIKNWRSWCDAWRLARIDHLLNEEKCYPSTYRILPTKLGNLLRATEDDLTHASGDVRRFVLQRRSLVSDRIQLQHDQFRSRLEMYCTMVFLCAFLVLLSPLVLLGRINDLGIAIVTTAFAIIGAASYLAAIASAEGYCTVLRQIDEAPDTPGTG